MRIEKHENATVGNVTKHSHGAFAEDGKVLAMDGRLDVRPEYQRAFVYNEEQQRAVVDTVLKGYPLNAMHWAVADGDRYQIIDGQQRTISLCLFRWNAFGVRVGGKVCRFDGLTDEQRAAFLDYRLDVHVCDGSEDEQIEWFKTINTTGKTLTDQEVLNAVYRGPFINCVRRRFGVRGCAGADMSRGYVDRNVLRQELVRQALDWHRGEQEIEDYMAEHRNDANSDPLWEHWKLIMWWARDSFPNVKAHGGRPFRNQDWNRLYQVAGGRVLKGTGDRIAALVADEDVTNQRGIVPFIVTGKPHHLQLRAFTAAVKARKLAQQGGLCADDGKPLALEDADADHIVPWSKGGRTTEDNCRVVRRLANQVKGDR